MFCGKPSFHFNSYFHSAADGDGDGDIDILANGPVFFENNGEGTFTEKVIWEDYLKKFNKRGENKLSIWRQKVIDNYIVDFYVPSIKLVIEIDWEIHNTKVEYDKERTQILEWYWLTEVRFTNDEINNNFITVCETLDNLLITK